MSKWILGQDVMDTYRVAPVEIGKACFDGSLTAFHRDLLEPIYDLSRLPRVPKYPPVGVDKMNHIQTGERVEWDWEVIQGVDKLRIKLRKAECLLEQALAVCKEKDTRSLLSRVAHGSPIGVDVPKVSKHNPFRGCTFEEAKRYKENLKMDILTIKNEILLKTEVSTDAFVEAESIVEEAGCHPDEIYSRAQRFAWNTLMPTEHFWLVNGELLEPQDLDSRLFFFDFAMFKRFADLLERNTSGGKASEAQSLVIYKQQISVMLFDSASVERWRQAPSLSNTVSDEVAEEYSRVAGSQKKGKKKLLAALYVAQGVPLLEIAQRLALSEREENLSNIYRYAREGRELAHELDLPPLVQ